MEKGLGIIIATTTGNIDTYQRSFNDCLRGTYRFSETIYKNLCTGQIYSVPNGFWDYVLAFGILTVAIVIVIALIMFIYDVSTY